MVLEQFLKSKAAQMTELFSQLYFANHEDSNHLLFHTEIRWSTISICTTRLHKIFNSVIQFMENKSKETRRKSVSYHRKIQIFPT